jgi:hypothetical protein
LSGCVDRLNRNFWRPALSVRAFILLFLTTSVVQAQQPSQSSDLGNVLAFFYRDPRPERLTGIFTSLQGQSLPWTAYPPLAGLFAGIFSLHPDWIARLTPNAPDAKAASTLVAALRLSGQQAKAEMLRAKFASSGFDQRLEAEFAGLPTHLEDLRITTPSQLDLLWGASFAGGDGRYVRPIIDFMAETANASELVAVDISKIAVGMSGGPRDIMVGLKEKYGDARTRQMIYAATALWAIRSNAIEHEYVKQAATKYIGDHPGTPATKALAAALTGIK